MPEHWYSNAYSVGAVDEAPTGESTYHFSKGGFQGNIGQGGLGGEWYIENVLEELDAPTEWFHDHTAGKLYYVSNRYVLITLNTDHCCC